MSHKNFQTTSIGMNNRENFLLLLINQNPGIRFNQLLRKSGLKNGVVSHYLSKLQKEQKIIITRTNRVCNVFPYEFSSEFEKLLVRSSQVTCGMILGALITGDRLTFAELAQKIPKSKSTVSFYLSKLVSDGLVEFSLFERNKIYRVKSQFCLGVIENIANAF